MSSNVIVNIDRKVKIMNPVGNNRDNLVLFSVQSTVYNIDC